MELLWLLIMFVAYILLVKKDRDKPDDGKRKEDPYGVIFMTDLGNKNGGGGNNGSGGDGGCDG